MRVAVRIAFASLLTLAFLVPAPAQAKDEAKRVGETEIAQAKSTAKRGEHANAGEILGKLIASVAARKDLDTEQRAAEALEEILDGVDGVASPDARGDAKAETWPGRAKGREVVAAVMAALDAKRHGVFVSAHALAVSIVLDAAALGDAEHLTAAAKVLAAYAATPKSGSAAAAFSRLAEGLRLARSNEADKAMPALEEAAHVGEPWLVPALYAHLELAVLRLAAGDAATSAEGMAMACSLAPKDADLTVMGDWMHAVEARWKAPKEALDAFRAATNPFLAASSGAAGGSGGKGASAGGDVSPIGRALPKWPAGKAFVTVKRVANAFEIGLPFDEKTVAKEALDRGARAWDASGVTVLLAGPAVALRMLDREGTRGQPGERLRPSRAWAWYWLADGETWAAAKDGVVVTGVPVAPPVRPARTEGTAPTDK
jgi:hypothetical protein